VGWLVAIIILLFYLLGHFVFRAIGAIHILPFAAFAVFAAYLGSSGDTVGSESSALSGPHDRNCGTAGVGAHSMFRTSCNEGTWSLQTSS
jgi:hypothetical protein